VTPDPGGPPPAPEPRWKQNLRLIGAFGLLMGCIFSALAWTVWPWAKVPGILCVALFPATALIAAAVEIVQQERSKGRSS